jgi:hypothetical protein
VHISSREVAVLPMETVIGAGGGWTNNSSMNFRIETGWALLGGGIGGKACHNQPNGMGAGGFGGGGGGCAAGGGGGGFAGMYVLRYFRWEECTCFYNTPFSVLVI